MRDVAQFFKVLADEARLKILWLLFHHQELCVCDIMEALGTTQSKASRHLATLRHAGLVADRRDGAWAYYSLRDLTGGLESAQLKLLRSKLADHAGASRTLQDLNDWLARKARLPGGACATKRRVMAAGARGLSPPGLEGPISAGVIGARAPAWIPGARKSLLE